MIRPWWHPDKFADRFPLLKARHAMMQAVRQFFLAQDFYEVETPCLQISPGLEPHLFAFATDYVHRDRATQQTFYLHTSPEFAMKKLLVAGVPRLFQMARVFRNGDHSRTHHPEFTMIEWYRANATYHELMQDCEGLLRACAKAVGTEMMQHAGNRCNPFKDWEYLSVAEAFDKYCDIDLLSTAPDPHAPDVALLAKAAAPLGIAPHEGDSWDDLFFRIFQDRIEPFLGLGAPTILYDYPISMAALSRQKAEDPRLAERFEIYVCGLELANAFGELTDPDVQEKRFNADMDLKQDLYGERYPVDPSFIAALRHGMPESAGIALGIDRLAMLLTGATELDSILWAPVEIEAGY